MGNVRGLPYLQELCCDARLKTKKPTCTSDQTRESTSGYFYLCQGCLYCDYLDQKYKHGYTTTVGRTHADGTVRLAREIPYGSPAWKEPYNRRNSSESRNSFQERLRLKGLPVHGLPQGYSQVLLGDFVANQRTLFRLMREATLLPPAQAP